MNTESNPTEGKTMDAETFTDEGATYTATDYFHSHGRSTAGLFMTTYENGEPASIEIITSEEGEEDEGIASLLVDEAKAFHAALGRLIEQAGV